MNIPLDELGARMHEQGSFSREIVPYCASGARSAYGQRLLQQLGYTKVKNGEGYHATDDEEIKPAGFWEFINLKMYF